MATDAFGRLRTSSVYSLFEYHPSPATSLHSLDEDVWVNTESGTGTLAYDSATNVIDLTVDADTATATRCTKLPMPYQPGKLRLFYFSVAPVSRVRDAGEDFVSRVGCFSVTGTPPVPDQGHWLETDGSDIWFVYKYTGTSATRTIQSSWNIDTFDGSGPSGKTLTGANMLTSMLLVIDQEWLGVGRVRFGFNLEGVTYYGHQYVDAFSYPYITTPRLPITYQIDGGTQTFTGGDVVLKQVCCTCISEGGYTPLGRRVSIRTLHDGTHVQNANTKYIIMGIKLQSGYPTGAFNPLFVDFCFPEGTASQWCNFELQVHSTNGSVGAVSSEPTFTAESDSILSVWRGSETGENPTVTTDGYVIHTNCVVQKSSTKLLGTEYDTQLKRVQLSQYDTLYVTAKITGIGIINHQVIANFDMITFS